ncbi:MAG TPA: ATP-dependent metallopeptidase FtsH/Yme1/Tma family protein [Tepidisphaeraceae bacterium]|jgi:ATP-dependent Zn protease|nr:ATP-dependent metallopeptidase FtsH/Yme1/Tma family protein [Tepidisphaeraceae bacterium]
MTQRHSSFRPERLNYSAVGPPRRFGKGLLGWIILICFAVLLVVMLQGNGNSGQMIPLSEFRAQLQAQKISAVNIDADELSGTMTTQAGATVAFRTRLPAGTSSNWAFTQWLLDHAGPAKIEVKNGPSTLMNILVPILPWLLIFGFIWFFVFRKLRRLRQGPSIFAQQYTTTGGVSAGWVNSDPHPGPVPPPPPAVDSSSDASRR